MKVIRKKYKGARFVTTKELDEILQAGQIRAEASLLAGLYVARNCERYEFPHVPELNKAQLTQYVENLLDIVDETLDVLDGKLDDPTFYYDRIGFDYFTPDFDNDEEASRRLYLYEDLPDE